MKKYACGICSLIIFFIALGIPVTSVSAIEKVTVAGGEVLPEQQQMEPVDEIATQSVQIAEYVLPFPGMLPDNPLYFLKRIRDTILEKLISDPVRKAEFYILQSDKRLQMGVMLIEQGKGSLGETTVSKAEKYMEQAVRGLSSYKQNGGVVPGYVIEKLGNAMNKHEEIITGLMGNVGETEKAGLMGSLTLLNELMGSLPSLQ